MMTSGSEKDSGASPTENAYVSDQPIQRKNEDRFDRGIYAARVARTIAERQDPSSLAIGLYAPWGEGKTSVLHLIEEALSNQPHVIPVWFNPWIFATQEDLIHGLFSAMATALEYNLKTTGQKIGDQLQKYGTAVSAIGSVFFQKNVGSGVSELGKQLSTVTLDRQKKDASAMLVKEGKRIVVFIDDIDRLDKTEIQAIFKLVKLTADLEQITYLMAFDDELVANSLQEQYGAGELLAGRRFLEKIIQVPLRLPRINRTTLRRYTLDAISHALSEVHVVLTQEQIQDFVHAYGIGLEVRISTPRMAKLYANAVNFALPILQDEVDPVEMMLIEGLRILFPQLYDAIREMPDMFLDPVGFRFSDRGLTTEQEQAFKDQIASILSPYNQIESKAALHLLRRLFPRLKDVYENHSYGASFDSYWANQKKVASYAYFDRYFSYAISQEDFPDRQIAKLVTHSEGESQEYIKELIRKSVNPQNASVFIQKLRLNEGSCNLDSGKVLARALSSLIDLFPTNDGMTQTLGSREQVAIFISEIISRISNPQDRFQEAREMVFSISKIALVSNLMYWLSIPSKTHRDQGNDEPILPIEKTTELNNLLADRIHKEAEASDLFESNSDVELRSLLHIWSKYRGRKITQDYLVKLLDKEPERIFRLIKIYMGTAMSLEDGRPLRGTLETEMYNTISTIIDPELVVQYLLKLVPAASNTNGSRKDFTLEEYIAHRFIAIHRSMHNHEKDEQIKSE